MDLFIPEDIGRQLAEINGMPSKLLRTKEQMDALKGQRAQAAQAQQLMAAAPVVSESMRNMAQAQALAASAPNQQAANIFAGGGQ
jgi:predicted component of type VI protein secretion system